MNLPVQPNISAILDALPSAPSNIDQMPKTGVLNSSTGRAGESAPSGNARRSSGLSFTVAHGHAARAAKSAAKQTLRVGRTAARTLDARIGIPACRTARGIRAASAELKIAVRSTLIRAQASLSPKFQGALMRLRGAAEALQMKAGGNITRIIERSVAQHCATLSSEGLRKLLHAMQKDQNPDIASAALKVPNRLQSLSQTDLSDVALPIIEKALAARQFGPCLSSLSNIIKAYQNKPAVGELDSQIAQLCKTTLAGCGLSVMHGRSELEAGLISQLDGKDHRLAQLRPLLNSKIFQSPGCSTETGLLLSALTTAVTKTIDKRLLECNEQWSKTMDPPKGIDPNDEIQADWQGRFEDTASLAFRDLNRLGLFNPDARGAAMDTTAVVMKHVAPLIGVSHEGYEYFSRQETVESYAKQLAPFANTSEKTWDRDQGPGTLFNDWKTRESQYGSYARTRGDFL